jgi:hypothetical protein
VNATTEAAQERDLIRSALLQRAISCRKMAQRRSLAGDGNAPARLALRAEAAHCSELAITVGRMRLDLLANALWGTGR